MFEPAPPPRLSTEAQQVVAHAMSEDALLRHIVDSAPTFGWRVIHFRDSRKQVKPDVFVGDPLARDWPV